MKLLIRALGLCGAFVFVAVAARAQTSPAGRPFSPPTLVYQALTRAPLTFFWHPVAPGPGYRISVSSDRRSVRASTLVAVRYQFQISANPSFDPVLYDRVVDTNSLLFTNDALSDPGFTVNQIPTHPLSAGTYFWRVRALAGEPVSPFLPRYSPIDRFTLDPGVTTTPLHDLGVSAITVAGRAIVGRQTPIVVRVSNLGTFPESGATMVFTANGVPLGQAPICGAAPPGARSDACAPLAAGAYVDIAVPWTPSSGPLAAITAQVTGVDEDARNNSVTQSVFVASATPVPTRLSGVVVPHKSGDRNDFAIADSKTRSASSRCCESLRVRGWTSRATSASRWRRTASSVPVAANSCWTT